MDETRPSEWRGRMKFPRLVTAAYVAAGLALWWMIWEDSKHDRAVSAALKAIRAEMADLRSDVEATMGDVGSIESKLGAVADAIDSLESEIGSIAIDVDSINSKVDDISNKLRQGNR